MFMRSPGKREKRKGAEIVIVESSGGSEKKKTRR